MIKVISRFFAVCIITYSLSCKNNLSKNLDKSSDNSNTPSRFITPIIDMNNGKDTNSVSFDYLFETYKIHYYKNLPQFFTLDDSRIASNIKMTHYAINNKGLYASFDVDSNKIRAFGAKYLDGRNGVDVILKPNGIQTESLKVWDDYTNDGMQYNFLDAGTKIMVFRFHNGVVIDSFLLHK